ncbi:protein C19orf12 homolog [Saccoglossus kowalevskii]|uniref:Protein C19orf12 homolog n=1 Tax=Saccoglossus kowalevskii TaxID=10224 RepID=A0ABM0MAW5_SACKO|nr:PREDICTED: protein C19orf12 homolog [Saccoglossus kowalevskii]
MPVSAEDLVRLLALLAEEEEMKVTVHQSIKGGLIAGGAVGGAVGAWATKGTFRPVSQILIDMNKEQRMQLQEYFSTVATNITSDDFMALSKLVEGDDEIRRKMICSLRNYFNDELKMEILD